jgi:hypothetical protein
MSLGILQFDMSMDNLLGTIQNPIVKNVLDEINTKYPLSKDCLSLDVSLKKAKDRISEINKERLAGYYVGMMSPKNFKNVTYSYVQKYQKAYKDRKDYIESLGAELDIRVLQIENKLVELNCRDEIEKIRLEESAKILTQQSAKSEQNFLKESNTEQYIYIGAGALVLLVGLYVILKK